MLRRSSRFLLFAVLLHGLLPFTGHAGTVTVEARVAASSDDAEQKVGSTKVSLDSSDLELVDADGSLQTVGMRFTGLGIPRGALITDAWVQFQVDEVTIAPASLTLRAQATDSAPTFSTAANDVAGRTKGSAAAGWTPAPWPTVGVAGLDQRAGGLAPLIQEVVNRPGWEAGNALVLLVTGSGARIAEAFDGSPSGAPLLRVAFDSPGTDFPPSLTLGSPADHAMFSVGQAVSFAATASDPESGDVTSSLTWTSSRDGPIGSGGSFVRSNLSTGIHTITATARDAGGQTASVSFAIQIVSGYHVLVGAGDISGCTTDHDAETAALLDPTFGTVITLGDNVYPNGTLSEFQTCYGPTWGRHKARTRPSLGNHDLNTPGGVGYFGYFGSAAGPAPDGYYSFDVDAWHVIVLNAECSHVPGGCTRTSPQGQWLAADLAAHPNVCTAAIMHRPRGSAVLELWQLLYEAGADVVLAGHQHNYERFAPQTPSGDADPSRGIRQFIVGTGGAGLSTLGPPHETSVARDDTSYGVLKLTLYPSSYDWVFLPAAGGSFTDTGSASCVDAGPVNDIPVVSIDAPAEDAVFPVNTAVTFSATAIDDEDGDLSASIRWSSDQSGLLGIGATLVTSALPSGVHQITASSTDGMGGIGTDVVNITIDVPGGGTTTTTTTTAPATTTTTTTTAPTTTTTAPTSTTTTTTSTTAPPTTTSSTTTTTTAPTTTTTTAPPTTTTTAPPTTTTAPTSTTTTTTSTTAPPTTTSSTTTTTTSSTTTTTLPPTPPEVAILSPASGVEVRVGDPILFAATASDPDEGDLSADLTWSSGLDGDFGTGASFSYAGLSLGLHEITASVTDGEGATGAAVITLRVDASGAAPGVTILSPPTESVFRETAQITFTGSANDPETGDVSQTLVWISQKDGEIGRGPSFSVSGLSRGKHTITVTATDPGGKQGSAATTLHIRR